MRQIDSPEDEHLSVALEPAKKRRRKPASLTRRTVSHLVASGWRAGEVERHISFKGGKAGAGFKRDLFGFVDVFAFRVAEPGEESVEERVRNMLERLGWDEDVVQELTAGDLVELANAINHRRGDWLAVQVCSGEGGDVAARVRKIQGEPQGDSVLDRAAALQVRRAARDWLLAGGRIEVHGWRRKRTKGGAVRYVLRVVEVTLADIGGLEKEGG